MQATLRVTDVDIEIPTHFGSPRFLAYAAVTLEHMLVIKNIRLIRMDDGRIIVAMPSRKRTKICEACAAVLPIDHDFCGCCGTLLPYLAEPGKPALDVVFPSCPSQRAEIDGAVLRAYDRRTSEIAALEWELARQLVRVGA